MTVRRGLHVAGRVGGLLGREAFRTVSARPRGIPRDVVEQQRAQAVRELCEDLGPFYIKVGQMLSTRPDLVPRAVIKELEQLHDRIAPEPFPAFETVLAQDLGPRWREHFREIDTERPLGAASLAQTYRAALGDGTPAVVKIQRPGIRRTVSSDMALLRRLARALAARTPRFSAVVDTEAMLDVIFQAMEPELDFTKEAANMNRARACAEQFDTISVPEVLLATEHVLVQSLAPGKSIREARPEEFSDEERTAIGSDLLAFMYRGFFVERFFHADPHPGNIFAEPGKGITLIDWGMTGRTDRSLSGMILLLFFHIARNDGASAARAWTALGHPTAWAQPSAFADDMANFVPKVAAASLGELDFGITLSAVLQYSTNRGIRVNPAIAILGKAFANIEGSIRCLCPEVAITDVLEDEIQEVVFELVRETLSEEQAACTALELLAAAPSGPQRLNGLLDALAGNQLALRVTSVKDQQTTAVDRAATRSRNRRRILLAAAPYMLWRLRRRRSRHHGA
ncbi:AarF/UbiB family protein [Streptomyces luteireticuli]|uniref:AarF/UbiB family protein n=1 Tax=Streptomyces luteireticuli TaxID=173858 RepID=A0ABN0Z0P5_9ACTN